MIFNVLIVMAVAINFIYTLLLLNKLNKIEQDIEDIMDNSHEHGDVDIDHPANWWNMKSMLDQE